MAVMLLAGAQDIARFGNVRPDVKVGGKASGGETTKTVKRTPAEAAAAISVAKPIRRLMTPSEFERFALGTATKDVNEKAVYIESLRGFSRQSSGISRIRVRQRISEGFFLCTIGEVLIALETQGDDLLLNGSEHMLNLDDTGRTYLHTTAYGLSSNVMVCSVVPQVTAQQVLQRFRHGEVFILPLKAQVTEDCVKCGGGGFVETRMGKRGGIRKTLCGECKGLKKVTVEPELLHYVSCAPAYIETLSFATTNAPPHEAESTLRHK